MTHEPAPLTRATFAGMYATPQAPGDIGRPQQAFVDIGSEIGGRVIDIGCGTGELALWLAERGCTVTGVDFLEHPLEVARQKAAARGLTATFLAMDAQAVGELPERFDAVTDCGLFHTFDETGRQAYVAALAKLLEPGSHVYLLCFSDAEPGEHGPRRISEAALRAAFADGFEMKRLKPSRFETLPGIAGAEFTPAGARSWFATIQRT